MSSLLHRITHWLGRNVGHVETWHSQSGTLMVGFRCTDCGKLSGIHPVPQHIFSQ